MMICNRLPVCAEELFSEREISKCNNDFYVCVESSDRRSKVKCGERRKKYTLENTKNNHVISYKMDGGIIVLDKNVPEGTCKCDYLFLINDSESKAVLIELKGVDVMHALKQIQGTLTKFKDFFKTFHHTYGRIIVASSVPNLRANPNYVNLFRMIRQSYGGNIKITEREFLEKDVELDNA